MKWFFVAAALLIGLCSPVSAQFSGNGIGGGGFASPPPASGCSPVLMLDCIDTGLYVAYSTRKLLTAYAGNAMQIQRASDSATSNIGFSSGVLDTATIATFCSATTCRVMTWYDQSGAGRNVSQSTFANAPMIFENSTGGQKFINTTRPAIQRTASTLLTGASVTQNPINTRFIAVVAATAAGTSALVGGSASNNFYFRVTTGTKFPELLASATASIATASSAVTASGSVIESQYISSTGVGSFWVDGVAAGTFTNAKTFAGTGTFQLMQDGAEALNGYMGEAVIYDLVGGIPSASRTTIEANQKAYWGTP